MNLDKLISISGKPGLFAIISQSKGGFIVEDIISKKKMVISSQSPVNLLENIAIYTISTEVPLIEVFAKIANYTEFKSAIHHKESGNKLREFMENILPDYDKERVYDSDLKKLFNWYNILTEQGIITKESVEKYQSESNKDEIIEEKNTKKSIKPAQENKKAAVVKSQGKVSKGAGNASKINMNKIMG